MMSIFFGAIYVIISLINIPLRWLFPRLDTFAFWMWVLYGAVALAVVYFIFEVLTGCAQLSDLFVDRSELDRRFREREQKRRKGG